MSDYHKADKPYNIHGVYTYYTGKLVPLLSSYAGNSSSFWLRWHAFDWLDLGLVANCGETISIPMVLVVLLVDNFLTYRENKRQLREQEGGQYLALFKNLSAF